MAQLFGINTHKSARTVHLSTKITFHWGHAYVKSRSDQCEYVRSAASLRIQGNKAKTLLGVTQTAVFPPSRSQLKHPAGERRAHQPECLKISLQNKQAGRQAESRTSSWFTWQQTLHRSVREGALLFNDCSPFCRRSAGPEVASKQTNRQTDKMTIFFFLTEWEPKQNQAPKTIILKNRKDLREAQSQCGDSRCCHSALFGSGISLCAHRKKNSPICRPHGETKNFNKELRYTSYTIKRLHQERGKNLPPTVSSRGHLLFTDKYLPLSFVIRSAAFISHRKGPLVSG